MTDPAPHDHDSGQSCTRVIWHAASPSPRAQLPRLGYALVELAPGVERFGFRLLYELGRGGFARVFLAQQVDLARRLVVLKFSHREGAEPQTLAQLQHTHIVPIYSVHEDEPAELRALCMPYFGGATLGQVMEQFGSGAAPVAGHSWVDALAAAQPALRSIDLPAPPDNDAQAPLVWLRQHSFIQGAVWIAARLAEALQHAHEHGVIHRDIKPSNILLGTDGQPLLLDFNVAQNDRLDPQDATLGGTITYAAPEHLQALCGRRPDEFLHVDRRSDVYSLGLVLFKMVTGRNPYEEGRELGTPPDQRSIPSARRQRADVPWSLDSILRRCLAPEASQRYQHAAELADDLQRFLDDRPLKFAPEPSRRERLQKWGRRHPRLVTAAAVTAVAATITLLMGASAVGLRRLLFEANEQLAVTAARQRREAYDRGTLRALCLVNAVSDLPGHRDAGMAVCEETLALYEVLQRPDWQTRPAWQQLEAAERRRLAENTRELLLLLAWARVRAGPHDAEVLHDALGLVERAAALADLPPSRALTLCQADFLEMLGQQRAAGQARARAELIELSGAADHYLLASAHARQGTADGLRQALAELDRALALNPRHYWALAQRGLCQQELGAHTLALADLSTCIGLWPDFAWGHFNRGCVLGKMGQAQPALRDFTVALALDPDFVEAYVNRGLLRLEQKEHAEALADFDQAQRLNRDDAFVHAGRGMALEGLQRFAAAEEAFASAQTRARALPDAARSRILWAHGAAVQGRLPEQARAAFEEVLRLNPRQPQALYGLAALAVEQARLSEARSLFDRAVAADPAFVAARRGRALVQARLGQWEAASADINWCLDKEPQAGITLYAAACVAALAAEKLPDPRLPEQALELLEKALGQQYGQSQAATDPDLRSLHDHAGFRRLLTRHK